MGRPRVTVLGLLLAAAVSGASDVRRVDSRPRGENVDAREEGLVFHLSEAPHAATPRVETIPSPAQPLDDTATRAVLDRLPEWRHDAREESFALPEESLPMFSWLTLFSLLSASS